MSSLSDGQAADRYTARKEISSEPRSAVLDGEMPISQLGARDGNDDQGPPMTARSQSVTGVSGTAWRLVTRPLSRTAARSSADVGSRPRPGPRHRSTSCCPRTSSGRVRPECPEAGSSRGVEATPQPLGRSNGYLRTQRDESGGPLTSKAAPERLSLSVTSYFIPFNASGCRCLAGSLLTGFAVRSRGLRW